MDMDMDMDIGMIIKIGISNSKYTHGNKLT